MYPFVDFCCGCCKDAFIESGAESSDASKWSQLLTCVLLRAPCQLYRGGGACCVGVSVIVQLPSALSTKHTQYANALPSSVRNAPML